jgi:hypothetical protein
MTRGRLTRELTLGLALLAGATLWLVPYRAAAQQSSYVEQVLYSFCGNGGSCPDGFNPTGNVVVGSAGDVYGTTKQGGISSQGGGCAGVIYRLTPSPSGGTSAQTQLYSFCDQSLGAAPNAGLLMDSAGNLYGTASQGGGGANSPHSAGVVFELSPNQAKTAWTYTVLYNFCNTVAVSCNDGSNPASNLIMDAAGNLYGTAGGGSTNAGVVFELTPNASRTAWTETVLHTFCTGGSPGSCADGSGPNGAVLMDASGNLYGAASTGGANLVGAIFELIPSQTRTSWTESILYNFSLKNNDGNMPNGGLVMDAQGNLYGTTGLGGSTNNGIAFSLTPNQAKTVWTENIIHNFGSGTDGGLPNGAMILDPSGNLLGTATAGGQAGDAGAVFELTPNATKTVWTEKLLFSFCTPTCNDGDDPSGGLFRDQFGGLYGATVHGNNLNFGIAYKLDIPLPSPLVAAVLPASRSVEVGDGFRDDHQRRYRRRGAMRDRAVG